MFTGAVLSLILKAKLKGYFNLFDLEHPAIGYEAGCYAKVLPIGKMTTSTLAKVFESIIETYYILNVNGMFKERDIPKNSKIIHEKVSLLKNIFDIESVDLYKRANWNLISFKLEEASITVFKSCHEAIDKILSNFISKEKVIHGISGIHLELDKMNRFVTNESLNKGDKILSILEQSNHKAGWQAIENHIYLFGDEYIVEIYDPSNIKITNNELELLQKLQMHLNKNVIFEWQPSINGGRFQDFIREVLSENLEVVRVREVGTANEPDGGRDLEITLLALQNFYDTGAYSTKNIIVQCKAYNKNVGANDVINIRDTIEHYDADGYWLVVSKDVTRSLYDRLDKMRKKGDYWIDWWGKTEIEQQLRRNLHIVNKYPDILSYKVF